MIRLSCLVLALAVASGTPAPAPVKPKAPPKEFTNALGMKFVWVPPGTFLMGTPDAERKGMLTNEVRHQVKLTKGFYMGVHPVTQEQWAAVTGKNPGRFGGEKNLPVERVSWDDCRDFVEKLRRKDGRPYRLPTEAEWEYACRAGTKTRFWFGDTISAGRANYKADEWSPYGEAGVYRKKTTPVGTFPANAFGLHDTHGNVDQWCGDWYGRYPAGGVVDPRGPAEGHERIRRGGSWGDHPLCCRSAWRGRATPSTRDDTTGLRVCFFPE